MKSFDYKKKFLLTLAIGLAAIILVFFISVPRTIFEFTENRVLIEKLKHSDISDKELNDLKNKVSSINESFKFDSSRLEFKNVLLEDVGIISQKMNVKLKNFSDLNNYVSENYKVESFEIVLEGNYKALVEAIYAIEAGRNMTKVASVRFYLQRNLTLKEDFLIASIIVQNVILTKDLK